MSRVILIVLLATALLQIASIRADAPPATPTSAAAAAPPASAAAAAPPASAAGAAPAAAPSGAPGADPAGLAKKMAGGAGKVLPDAMNVVKGTVTGFMTGAEKFMGDFM